MFGTIYREREKAPEPDNLIALRGTIYGTSMYASQVLLRIHCKVTNNKYTEDNDDVLFW